MSSQERLWLDPPGWSRAQFLGTTESSKRVPIALDPQGNLYAGFFSAGDSGGLTITKFASDGRLAWGVTEDQGRYATGRNLQLVWHESSLHALWIDAGDLLLAQVDIESGNAGPMGVLVEDRQVRDFSTAASDNGKWMVAFSGSRDEPGVYFLQYPELSEPVLIDPEGVRPQIAFDAYSNLHAVWMYQPAILQDAEIRYAFFPEASIQPQAQFYRFPTQYRTTDVIEGPFLGVDLTHVYIGDTAMIRTGMREGEVETKFRAFPLGDPQQSIVPVRLYVPMDYELLYAQPSPESGLQIGPRAAWSDLIRNTDQIVEVVSTSTTQTEVALAFHERVSSQSGQSQAQIGLITLQSGEPQSYQLVSFTSTGSKRPNLAISPEGYVFLSWLELTDVRTYSVYVATTKPDLKTEFDAVTFQDWQTMIGNMVFGMLSGLVLFPVAFLWMIPPLLLIAVLSVIRRREEKLTQPGHLISLLLGLAVFQYLKFGVFASLKTTVPFVQWFPIMPVSWYHPLQVSVPILVVILSASIAVNAVHRRGQSSPTILFILYSLIDGILTLALFGGSLFGM